jgi:hypothetical protein
MTMSKRGAGAGAAAGDGDAAADGGAADDCDTPAAPNDTSANIIRNCCLLIFHLLMFQAS